MSDKESVSPDNDFFNKEDGNSLDEKKYEETEDFDLHDKDSKIIEIEEKKNAGFLSYMYKQLECCCINFMYELKDKDQLKANNIKKKYINEYKKSKKSSQEFSVFDKIIKKNSELLQEVSLDAKHFNVHADWCECAHELNVDLTNEEVEFCVFSFFLKMYRSEERDKELLLSIILDCLYSKKDFKKEYYTQKGDFKFLKEMKAIECYNFKESLNKLMNEIENAIYIQNTNIQNTNDNDTTTAASPKLINVPFERYNFKLYVIIKIKYTYGVYIFHCGETYDIVVIDCNTVNKNKPKIMSFYSLRKFVLFLNSIYAMNYNDENVHDSFPIIIYESRECYVSSHAHLPLKKEIFEQNKKKEKKSVVPESSIDQTDQTEQAEEEEEEEEEHEEEQEEQETEEKILEAELEPIYNHNQPMESNLPVPTEKKKYGFIRKKRF